MPEWKKMLVLPGIHGKFTTKNEVKGAESGSHFVTKTSDKEDWCEFLTNVLEHSSMSW